MGEERVFGSGWAWNQNLSLKLPFSRKLLWNTYYVTGTLQKALDRLFVFNPQRLAVDVFLILFHPSGEGDIGRLEPCPREAGY